MPERNRRKDTDPLLNNSSAAVVIREQLHAHGAITLPLRVAGKFSLLLGVAQKDAGNVYSLERTMLPDAYPRVRVRNPDGSEPKLTAYVKTASGIVRLRDIYYFTESGEGRRFVGIEEVEETPEVTAYLTQHPPHTAWETADRFREKFSGFSDISDYEREMISTMLQAPGQQYAP